MDKVLICKRCGNTFDFTEGEQEFYTDRGLNEPKRCPECRDRNKDRRIEMLENQVKQLSEESAP